MATTKERIIEKATADCIAQFGQFRITDLLNRDFAKDKAGILLDSINSEIDLENGVRKVSKQNGISGVESLPVYTLAEMILATGDFKLVRTDDDSASLAVNAYDRYGKYTGIMRFTSFEKSGGKNIVATLCRRLSPTVSKSSVEDVVYQVESELNDPLQAYKYVTYGNKNHHLLACNNGIWNYDTKEFTAHDSPDRWTKYPDVVFLNKLDTNYVPMATSPTFVQPDGTTWTVDGFFESLFDMNTEIGRASAAFIWELIQFSLRGYSGKEGHMAYFCNASDRARGQNGKTALINLIMFIIDHWSVEEYKATHKYDPDRAVNGTKVVVASIDKWHKDYMLARSIKSAMLLVSDENEEGSSYIDGSGFLKNLSRHQPNLYNPKFEPPFSFAYMGMAFHLQNETTRMNSTDDANFTHRAELRMEKDFSTANGGNPLVKSQYVIDERVAEYVLWKVTQMECLDDFSPDLLEILEANVEDTKNDNIPTHRFLAEVLPGMDLQKVPAKWLYEMYDKSWRVQEGITKKITFQQFKKDLMQYIYKHRNEYEWFDKPFFFKEWEVNIELRRSNVHSAILEYGKIDEYHALSFIEPITLEGGKTYPGRISRVAMSKQITSGAVVKKDYNTNVDSDDQTVA